MVQEYGSRSADFICGKFNWDEVVGETAELVPGVLRPQVTEYFISAGLRHS